MTRVLIKNGYVITVDRRRSVHPGGFVLINGSKIESVGSSAQLPMGAVDRTIDALGMVVIPGLINAHQHFYYHLFKGLGHGLLLEDWFPHLVFPVLPHLTDDDMELTSYLAGIEMLSTGTTCCLNHLRTTTSEALLQRISAPTAEIGLRQVIGKEVQCRLPGNPRHPRNIAEEIAYVEELIPRWKDAHEGLTRICLVAECTSVFVEQKLTSEELLIESKKLADRHGLKLAAHISGGTLSFDKSYLQILRKTGQTDAQMLMQMGLLDSSWILVHGINCTPTDLRLIANSGASLIYCPTSEAVRGGGIGPAAPALAAGVNVALGSDGPMVDDSVDMIEQMKACSFLQGVKHLDPTIMPPERCIEMATINAAQAMGLDGEIGSLEAGKLADIAIFDLDTPHSSPATNPIASLVFSARGPDAHMVFVNGREVVRDHKLTTFGDVKSLFARARARAQEIVTKAGLSDRAKSAWQTDRPDNRKDNDVMKQVSRRTFLASSGTAGLGLLAGNRSMRAQGRETLNIGLSPFINQATIFMANDLGYFSKMGLDIRMKIFMDGALVVAPMLSGEVEIGVMTPNAGFFNSIYRGGPFHAFLCNGQGRRGRAVTAVVIRSDHYDAGVKTLPDLAEMKGKTAAVGAAGSINQYGLGSALKLAGLDPMRDVQWQTSVPQPDIVKQLGQKQVDVAEITYHLAYLAQKQGFCRILLSRDEILPDSQAAIHTVRDDMLQRRRETVVRYAMACIQAGRLFNQVAGDPDKHADMLKLIVKSIFPRDEALLKAVAPHWEWIAEDGMPNIASIMAQQDFWADTFKMVERKVPQDRVIDASIAKEAVQRLTAEKPFG